LGVEFAYATYCIEEEVDKENDVEIKDDESNTTEKDESDSDDDVNNLGENGSDLGDEEEMIEYKRELAEKRKQALKKAEASANNDKKSDDDNQSSMCASQNEIPTKVTSKRDMNLIVVNSVDKESSAYGKLK
jgi:hypothetical protein